MDVDLDEKGPQVARNPVRVKQPRPQEEEEVLSAMPDPDNRKWHDSCYYLGESCFHRLPLLHDAIEAVAPDTILEPKGALEKTCGLIIFSQMIVVASYIYFLVTGYMGCMDIRFLSLIQTPTYCREVKNAINEKYSLDDNGYWDTYYEWSFAESMCGGNFVDFQTTDTEWLTYSKGFWKIFDDWNTKWSTKASVDNIMAMVVSEKKVPGDELLLAHVLADPISVMNTNFKDCVAVNNMQSDGSFILEYNDLDSRFFLSAAQSKWSSKLPKWKFATNTLDDALSGDDGDDPTQGVMINKYSLWVAAAINMGIIDLKDLTKLSETSVTSAYSVTTDDGGFDDDYGAVGDDSTARACVIPGYYQDGYCDSVNNVAACDYDGGDCCESTCGVGYETDVECGVAGYTCSDPNAVDTGQSDTVQYDDDYFDDGFTGGAGGYYYFNDDDATYYFAAGDSCTWYDVLLMDDACDGWEGNYLHIGSDHKFTLESGCNATEYVCLESGHTYKPYACGGDYPSEISWVISTYTGSDDYWDDDFAAGGADDDTYIKTGGGSVTCSWENCGSVTITIAARRLTEESDQKKLTPPPVLEKMEKRMKLEEKKKAHLQRRLLATPTALPSALPSASPTALPSINPTPSPSVPTQIPTPPPTHSPTIYDHYKFGLTDYVLFKYYEEMDPIQCSYVNGSQYCWIKGNAGEKGTEDEYLGAYLFPMIQHYDKDCYNCSSTAANNPDDCNDVDLEVLLFFNPLLVSEPHFVQTYNASYQEERRKYNIDNSGLDGLIYLNLYGGVKYLNELFYAMPNTHCTKPIAIAKGVKTKNSLACGTKYQEGLLDSKKKSVRKTAEKSYCQNTPTSPQERYFECRYSPQECVSTAIAEASGQASLVASVATLMLVFFVVHFMGIPKNKRGKEVDVDVSETGFFGSMAMKAKGAFQTAKVTIDEQKEKRKSLEGGDAGDIEMSGGSKPYIAQTSELEGVTLESLQEALINQRVSQEAKVKALNEKIDKLLAAHDAKFTPSSTPGSAPKSSAVSKHNEMNL